MSRTRFLTAVGAATLAVAIGAALPGSALAAPVSSTFTTAPGTTYGATAMTGFATDGSLMGGMLVTVNFGGGGSETASWSGATSSAVGSGWSLSQPGDTFSSLWTLTNSAAAAITGFSLNGVPGNTTFDILTDATYTPNSGSGLPFGSVDASNTGDITNAVAAYSNQLQVGGTFYGDEYVRLDVALIGNGLLSGEILRFMADTDNATAAGGIVEVPEPASLALLGAAFLGVVATRRRRDARVGRDLAC